MWKKKPYVTLTTKERQRLNQLLGRKLISRKAKQQITALLLLDKGGKMVEVYEGLGICHQTLSKWRDTFTEVRMNSLLVFQEDIERKGE